MASYKAVNQVNCETLKKKEGANFQKPKEKLTYLFLLPKREWTPNVNKQHKHWKVCLHISACFSPLYLNKAADVDDE